MQQVSDTETFRRAAKAGGGAQHAWKRRDLVDQARPMILGTREDRAYAAVNGGWVRFRTGEMFRLPHPAGNRATRRARASNRFTPNGAVVDGPVIRREWTPSAPPGTRSSVLPR